MLFVIAFACRRMVWIACDGLQKGNCEQKLWIGLAQKGEFKDIILMPMGKLYAIISDVGLNNQGTQTTIEADDFLILFKHLVQNTTVS